jgi:methylmalonyl-CoA/ethylmalonyl-CoA epimerase
MNLSHISIAVPDLEAAIKTMRELYQLSCGTIDENRQQGVRLAYVDLGNSKIELMQPLKPDSPVGRFLAKRPGGGLHHLCLAVGNVASLTTVLRDKGVRSWVTANLSTTSTVSRSRLSIRRISWLAGRNRTTRRCARGERLIPTSPTGYPNAHRVNTGSGIVPAGR